MLMSHMPLASTGKIAKMRLKIRIRGRMIV